MIYRNFIVFILIFDLTYCSLFIDGLKYHFGWSRCTIMTSIIISFVWTIQRSWCTRVFIIGCVLSCNFGLIPCITMASIIIYVLLINTVKMLNSILSHCLMDRNVILAWFHVLLSQLLIMPLLDLDIYDGTFYTFTLSYM